MRKREKRGRLGILRYYCANFYSEHKTRLFIALAFVGAGMIIGFIVAGKNPANFFQSNFITDVKTEEYKIGSEFFKFFLFGTIGLGLIYLNIFSRWLKCLSFALMVFAGFKLAAAMVGLIAEAVVGGIICLILFYLPLFLCLIFIFDIAFCIISQWLDGCGKGPNAITAALNKTILKKFAYLEAFLLAFCIVFAVIIPLIFKLIVVF